MGGGISQNLPQKFSREEFLRRLSDVYMQALFEKLQVDGFVSRDQVEQLVKEVGYQLPLNHYVCEHTLHGHKAAVTAIVQLKDGRLATASDDNSIKIWNMDLNLCERTFDGSALYDDQDPLLTNHRHGISRLIQLQDGRLASGSIECTKIWHLTSDDICETTIEHGSVSALIELQNGTLLMASLDMDIRLWNPHESSSHDGDPHSLQTTSLDPANKLWATAISELPDGRIVCVAGMDRSRIEVWNYITHRQEKSFHYPESSFSYLLCLADGRIAAVDQKKVKIIELRGGVIDQQLECDRDILAVLSLRDEHLVTTDGKFIHVWYIPTGKCVLEINCSVDGTCGLYELSQGRIASRSNQDTIKTWNPTTGLCEKSLSCHPEGITQMLQLGNGRLATALRDGSVKVWS